SIHSSGRHSAAGPHRVRRSLILVSALAGGASGSHFWEETMLSFLSRVAASMGLAAALLLPPAVASAQTIADIEAKGRVAIGVLTGIPPYDTVDASGNTDGFLADLARAVAKGLGVEVDLVPVNNASRAA